MQSLLEEIDSVLAEGRGERYWHATSRERADSIIREGVLRASKKKGGVFSVPAGAVPKGELLEVMATWMKGRGYYPDKVVIIEFETGEPANVRGGARSHYRWWPNDIEISNARIVAEEPFLDLIP